MSNAKPPPTIEQIGLDNYLNNTAPIHNGYGFKDFVKLINHPNEKRKVSISSLAVMFNVSRSTIYHWSNVYWKLSVAPNKIV